MVQGKEKYSKPVIQDILDQIKEEPKSPEKEEEAVETREKNEENEKQEGITSGEKSEVKKTQEGNENQKSQEKKDKARETEEKTAETEKQEKNKTRNQNLCKEQSPTKGKTTSTKGSIRGSEKETEAHGLETMITTTVGNVMKSGSMSDRVTVTAVNSIIPPEELEEEEEEEEEEAMQSETSTEMVPKTEDVSGSSSTGMSLGFKENSDDMSKK